MEAVLAGLSQIHIFLHCPMFGMLGRLRRRSICCTSNSRNHGKSPQDVTRFFDIAKNIGAGMAQLNDVDNLANLYN
jgi:hypothetical protein